MKTLFYISLITLAAASFTHAQNQPFIFTLYGGLFFPAHQNFRATHQSSSDLIWGGGVCLPMQPTLYAAGDISFFYVKSIAGPQADSTVALTERFIHVGILNKQLLGKNVLLRLSGGISYVYVKQTTSGPQTPGQSREADKRIGYYGGIGFEQPLDIEGRLSLFCDGIYDYRRSKQEELYGDFGGVRLILGMHLFLF